jgi:cell division protein FtsI (penicillin-binding protein 3)
MRTACGREVGDEDFPDPRRRQAGVMRTGNPRARKDWSGMRIILLAGALVLVWTGLWVKTYLIQVVHGVELSEEAKAQYWTRESVRGLRGDIYSSRGALLAKSITVDSVFVRPREIEDPERVSRVLARILNAEPSALATRLNEDSGFVWIERKIGDKKAERIRSKELAGVYLTQEPRRIYPQGQLAGQLLGFVGMDNRGLEGIELSFDTRLSGRKRELLVQRDAFGRVLYAPGELTGELSGKDVVLTLDTRVQFAAEKAISEAVRQYGGDYGMFLVVKVDSGHILASAQYPFFNPNCFRRYSPRLWRNRAALDAFEAGSSMKPFLVASALDEGLCEPKTIYYCENGSWRFQGYSIKDTHKYGWLPVRKILRYSSNIGAAKIGLDLGAEAYVRDLRALGLGKSTSLPLPSENEGILRGSEQWNRVELVSGSFGQGFSQNLYQMGRAYLCLANKGVRKPLTLVRQPEREKPGPTRVYSERTANTVLDMMESVVEGDGTGTRANIQGIHVGGKTGTAQQALPSGGYGEDYLAVFAGLIPSRDPEYLLLAVVDSPTENHYGGVVAAPAVRKVGQTLLRHTKACREWRPTLGGDAAHESRERAGARNFRIITRTNGEQATNATLVPDLRGMPLRLAMEVLARRGSVPAVKGAGVVVARQSPEPGSEWKEENVVLWLGGGEKEG